MDILRPDSGLQLGDWAVRTNNDDENPQRDRPPAHIGAQAQVINSVISAGCVVDGLVRNTILSPGVRVEKGTEIIDSVIMQDCIVQAGSKLVQVIADKNVHISAGAQIGGTEEAPANEKYPDHLFSGLTIIGKRSMVPRKIRIGANSIVEPMATEKSFESALLKPGCYVAC